MLNTYSEILSSPAVKNILPENGEWWSKYIYHFTDINNAANILNKGYLYSRNYSNTNNLMINDNASKGVLDITNQNSKDFVRFYFRPLTPTQYNNEGFRPKSCISYLNAHCPVPVFFLFNADKMLSRDDSFFTYESLATTNFVPIYNTLSDFKKAPFELIYHNTPINNPEERNTIVKHRHAEVLIPHKYNLEELDAILCRSIPDVFTLRSLLEPAVLDKFKDKIRYVSDAKLSALYNNSYLYLKSVSMNKDTLEINWNRTLYASMQLDINFFSLNKEPICYYKNVNYAPHNLSFQLDTALHLSSYKEFIVEILHDEHLIYKNHFTR